MTSSGASSLGGYSRCVAPWQQQQQQLPTAHLLPDSPVCHPTLQECSSKVNSIDFHRTHDLLVSAGDDDVLHVYDTAEGRHVAAIPSSKYGCQNVVWTHAPDKVVFASNKVGGSCKDSP